MGHRDRMRETGTRIEALLDELANAAEPRVRDRAEELVRLLTGMYGEGLARVLTILAEAGPPGRQLVDALGEDGLVGPLLALHDLHPVPVETRVTRALDSVRPYLGSHAGGVELLGIGADGVVRLRLQGSCDGCASSAMTVKLAIEAAITAAAPEVVAVEAEGVAPDPQPLLQIQPSPYRSPPASTSDAGGAEDGWWPLDGAAALRVGELTAASAAGVGLLLARLDGGLYAYRDGCPRCGGGLDGAALAAETLVCAACGGRYDLHHAGRGLDGGGEHLDPLPLLTGADGAARVALPALGAAP